MTHGKATTYTDKHCRCDECRHAHAVYRRLVRKRRYLRHGAPALIDGTGTRRRIEALNAMGWPLDHIDAAMGVARSYSSMVMRRKSVTPTTYKLVSDVYDRLCMTHGPSARAAGWAKRKGYMPPLAWDDIDDPSEVPNLEDVDVVDEVAVARLMAGRHTDASRMEKIEATRRLAATGRPDSEIADLIGTTQRTVQRWRSENGIAAGWVAA